MLPPPVHKCPSARVTKSYPANVTKTSHLAAITTRCILKLHSYRMRWTMEVQVSDPGSNATGLEFGMGFAVTSDFRQPLLVELAPLLGGLLVATGSVEDQVRVERIGR